MSVRDLSWRALLYGCLFVIISWSAFLILAIPIEMAATDLILKPPWTNDEFMAEYMAMDRWLTLIISLAGTLVSFGLGGFFAAKIAKSKQHLHSFLVAFIIILASWIVTSGPNLFEFARFSVIAVLSGLLGGRMAIRAKLKKDTI